MMDICSFCHIGSTYLFPGKKWALRGFPEVCMLSCVWLFATLWDFPGKNIGVDCHLLLQGLPFFLHRLYFYPPGIFLTQGTNLHLLQADSLLLSHQGSQTKIMSDSCLVMSTLCNPWTVAHQASLSMEFSRQEYWSGLSFPSPRDHLELRI